MKATGIVRQVDDLGRIVIPMELRRNLNIGERDALEIYTNNSGNIIMKKYEPGCQVADCNSLDDLFSLGGVCICSGCLKLMHYMMVSVGEKEAQK